MEDNVAAANLYKKLGFIVEGVMRDAYYGQDDNYHNLPVMGLLLPAVNSKNRR